MLDYQRCLSIGKIVKPIGIKGAVKVISLSDFPERFLKSKSVYLFDEKTGSFIKNHFMGGLDFEICESSIGNGFFRVGFSGYNRIEDVSDLIGAIVMIDETDRYELKEGRYYYYDLVGLEVYDKGSMIGKVDSIVDYGSGDLFRVVNEGKEILIPFMKEFVKEIDLKGKRIDVELIEGFH